MTFYRRNLPHLQCDYKPHFITFVTKFRLVLPDWARDITLGCCLHDHGIRYSLHVAVVMPNHVHLILTPLTDQKRRLVVSLIETMRAIKGASARAINQRLRLHGAVWQEESFDHVLRSSENLDAKIDYILQNPVRAGLVRDWQMYPWCGGDRWQIPTSRRRAARHNKSRSPGRIRPGPSITHWMRADECVRHYAFRLSADKIHAPDKSLIGDGRAGGEVGFD